MPPLVSFVMRYAIVSDIHANLTAWKAVLNDLSDQRIDKIICLGDIIGYGPDPIGVLESVHRVAHVTLMGNHDAAVCGKIDAHVFSARAQEAVLRHRALFSTRGLAWLSGLPLELTAPLFRCAHGDFSEPAAFRYIIDPTEALPSWKVTQENLLFVGHTHLPGIHVIGASGVPHRIEPCDFEIEPGKRYIINPGSVGYPRIGSCRSSYCLFDDADGAIFFRSLPFDCEGYAAALREAGLSPDSWLVEKETEQHLPSIRARLSFARPLTNDQQARDVRRHAHLSSGKTTRWRRYATPVGLAASLAALAAAGLMIARRPSSPDALALSIPPFDLPALAAFPIQPRDKNLLPALPAAFAPDGRLPGWRLELEDRDRQRFETGLRQGAATLRISHEGPARARIESPMINLAGAHLNAVRLRGRIHRLDGFNGAVFFQVITYAPRPGDALATGATHSFEVRDTRRRHATGVEINRKIAIPRSVTHLRFRVDADFAGWLEIEQPVLTDAPTGQPASRPSEQEAPP